MNIKFLVNDDGRVTADHDIDGADATVGVYVDDVKVLGSQEAHIANASVAHNLNATFSDTEAETALNALGTKINSVLTALRNHGILASS